MTWAWGGTHSFDDHYCFTKHAFVSGAVPVVINHASIDKLFCHDEAKVSTAWLPWLPRRMCGNNFGTSKITKNDERFDLIIHVDRELMATHRWDEMDGNGQLPVTKVFLWILLSTNSKFGEKFGLLRHSTAARPQWRCLCCCGWVTFWCLTTILYLWDFNSKFVDHHRALWSPMLSSLYKIYDSSIPQHSHVFVYFPH